MNRCLCREDMERLHLLFNPVEGALFSSDGYSRRDLVDMAARILAAAANHHLTALCIATDNRAVIAAALLAALVGGPQLLLPHSFSRNALEELRGQTGFTAALAGGSAVDLTPGITMIDPVSAPPATFSMSVPIELHKPLLTIFTGGSTGRPRLWQKTGDNIFGEAMMLARHFAIGANERILATVPPLHIYGLLFSVVLPMVAGGMVVADTLSFPADIESAIRARGVTVLVAVPAHYRAMRHHPPRNCAPRLAFSSAGPLAAEDGRAFRDSTGTGVIEIYGSTETGGIAVRNRSRGQKGFVALPGVDWQIREGRLAVRSAWLSPGLTTDQDGFFHTADRVEPLDNGFMLRGRVDGVAKVGGKRVDLEEVRQHLLGYAGVEDCAVMALPETSGRGMRICALVQGQTIDTRSLQSGLGCTLEPAALPKTIVRVDRIPMRQNGKYDRQAILRLLLT